MISACLQDALVSVARPAYDRDARRFILVANRFRWEGEPGKADGEAAGAGFERTLCAVVVRRGRAAWRIAAFAAATTTASCRCWRSGRGTDAGTVDLEFSGGAAIRLGVSAIRVHATDLGEPWPTAWQPDHAGWMTRPR